MAKFIREGVSEEGGKRSAERAWAKEKEKGDERAALRKQGSCHEKVAIASSLASVSFYSVHISRKLMRTCTNGS